MGKCQETWTPRYRSDALSIAEEFYWLKMEHVTQANIQNCANYILHRTVNAGTALALSTVKAVMHSFAMEFLFSHPNLFASFV